MVGDSLIEAIGSDLDGSIATLPGGAAGADAFTKFANANGVTPDGPFVPESYDAAALIVLAMQAAGSADRAALQSKMMMVANAPGKKIGPGELDKALKIIAAGGDVDYQGATNVEFNEVGEVFGSYFFFRLNRIFITTNAFDMATFFNYTPVIASNMSGHRAANRRIHVEKK
jgi:branched-chain amino acid transport system substrate-binding protein